MIYLIIYVVIAIITFFLLYAYFCKEYKSLGGKDDFDRWLSLEEYDAIIICGSAAWIIALIIIPFIYASKMIKKHYDID